MSLATALQSVALSQSVASVPALTSRTSTSSPAFRSTSPPVLRLAPSGEPLHPAVRGRLESTFGADLRAVRVHSDARAASAADSMMARAFTVGNDIFLAARERPDDLGLLAHEVAHVIQQRGNPVPQRFSTAEGGDSCEREAGRASVAAEHGQSFAVAERTHTHPQAGLLEFLESTAWSLLNDYVPDLVPILRKGPEGVFDWLKERIASGFEALVDNVMAPVRAVSGVGRWLSDHFTPLLTWMQDAAAKIAKNDCTPLREAAGKIEDVVSGIITPIVEKIQAIAGKVGDFFKGVWEKLGAPVWDWIKKYAGKTWDQIQRFAGWIWDGTAPIRKILARAWTWLKNKIGIGEGPEGQNGIIQWVQRKAEAAWDWIKAKIEPYKKQLLIIAGIIGGLALAAASPVIIVGGIVVGLVQGVRWIKANWGKGNAIVEARAYVEKTLIPKLTGMIERMTAEITRMAASINGKLGELTAGMGRMVSLVAASILRAAVAAMQWIADRIGELAEWGSQKLQKLAEWIRIGLEKLRVFLQPVMDFLKKVTSLAVDIMGLPLLLAGKLWDQIPRCIRDPFIDWIIPLILRQISIFRELIKDNEAWQKTKADAMNIVRQVFVHKNLRGAIRATFDLVLRIFNIPRDLLDQIRSKAAKSWNEISAAPISFIKNCVRVVGRGLQRYGQDIKTHLTYGLEGWLLGEIAEKGIRPPKKWSDPKELFGFVLDVLGLSMNHVFELLKQRFDKDKIETLRRGWARITRAWDWIQEYLDKSPADVTKGLIDQAKGFGAQIIEDIVVWITKRVAAELAAEAAAAAATVGLSEVISVIRRIYLAIEAAVKWARKIVDMVNRALDAIGNIIAGVIAPAAVVLENAMHIATPAVIGFLGGMVGLGGVGDAIRDSIDKLRALVDKAILWLIDKIKAGIEAVIKGVGSAVAALKEWWKKRKTIKAGGETHTLSFSGDEDNAELTIESTPRRIEEYVQEARQVRPPTDKPTLDAIEAQAAIVRDARSEIKKLKKSKASDALLQPPIDKLNAAFEVIGGHLEKLFAGSDAGTSSNPISLKWPKPAWHQYRPLFLYQIAGSSGAAFKITAKENTSQKFIKKYLPTGAPHVEGDTSQAKPPPELDTLGIKGKFRLDVGSEVGPLSTGETPGGGEINNRLEKHGWSADAEGLDGDHVQEMQFGGENVLANLWPLDFSINRGAGSSLSRQSVKLGAETITVDLLKKVKPSPDDPKEKFRFRIVAVNAK